MFKSPWEKRPGIDFGILHTDVHSHLIPGIDDGAPTVRESLKLLRTLSKMGYRKVITTPHVMAGHYANTPEQILAGLAEVREAVEKAQLEIQVETAAEYFIDEQFLELLEEGRVLTFGNDHLLFEFSFISPPLNLREVIFRMRMKGYQPVLAHPERYILRRSDLATYQELKSLGCKFQVNLLSIAGYYGRQIKESAHDLIRKGQVEFLGTDLHNERQADFLRHAPRLQRLRQVLRDFSFENASL